MTTKKKHEIIEALESSDLKEEDYFDSSVFYYLSGRFPDLTISQCTDIVDIIRQKFMDDNC